MLPFYTKSNKQLHARKKWIKTRRRCYTCGKHLCRCERNTRVAFCNAKQATDIYKTKPRTAALMRKTSNSPSLSLSHTHTNARTRGVHNGFARAKEDHTLLQCHVQQSPHCCTTTQSMRPELIGCVK